MSICKKRPFSPGVSAYQPALNVPKNGNTMQEIGSFVTMTGGRICLFHSLLAKYQLMPHSIR